MSWRSPRARGSGSRRGPTSATSGPSRPRCSRAHHPALGPHLHRLDGLLAIVQDELAKDAYSGHLFVFVSRRCDRAKILTWDKGGFVLVYKRLERGQFKLPHMDPSTMAVEIDATQLAMLLDGIDFGRVRRPDHWQPQPPGGRPMDKVAPT